MKNIVLMGNPNVGKSVVFSRLTGAKVIISNYPGTTVDFSRGKMRLEGQVVHIIDAPGVYSLVPSSRAEEVAATIFNQADLVINVVDATNLERNLFLALEILETKKPAVLALNMWDEAKHLGININDKALEELLGVPVVPTVALTGEGIKELVKTFKEARSSESIKPASEEERWVEIGHIIREVQTVTHRHHTTWEQIADATIKPTTGIPIAMAVIFVAFWMVRLIGENLIGYALEPLFELYRPIAMALSDRLGSGFLHDVLIGKLLDGEIDFVQSLGILTTGIFVPFGMVLPYIFAFYFTLAILEDSGYLPRLATLSDNIFHKLGMHGYGVISVFLGLGCNVPGALSTRTLETRKQRFIAATLMAIAVPCMAQIAMIFAILGPHGFGYIGLVFGTLSLVYVLGGLLLNRFVQGECPEIFLEIPPYRKPSLRPIAKKTWMRIRWFLAEAIPWLFLGVVLVNLLYAVGFIEWLGHFFAPLMVGWLGLPKETTAVLLVGFLRKDLAVGMLLPLGMTPMQLVIAVTILTIYFPCVGTFAVLVKELGISDMLKAATIMVFAALLVGGLMKFLLIGL
ncbi:MAG: ferrous iron transporter B [Desulfuromonadaceae bacterium]|nr:ferrous iron transporter B [Desulfuromonadaceae bacterium]